MRYTVTQPIRNSAEASTYPSAILVAAAPWPRCQRGGPANGCGPATDGSAAAACEPAAASRIRPAAITGTASSDARSPNDSGTAAAAAGAASNCAVITPTPHSAAAIANQR
jgi:hypothetical protein